MRDKDLRTETHAYLGGVSKKLNCHPIRIGGVADHVHLLTTLSRTISMADFIKEIKRVSTKWIQKQSETTANFHWQAGYGIFSVAQSQVDQLVDYIDNQEEHHRTITFQDEFRAFLRNTE